MNVSRRIGRSYGTLAAIIGAAALLSAGLARRDSPEALPSGPSREVPAVLTAIPLPEAREALRDAYTHQEGRRPSDRALAMLLAHSALETAGWRKMWCWNYGNITTRSGDWYVLGEDRRHRYQCYDSSAVGAAAFVALLRRRYSEAWALLDSGDCEAYARALKSRGYYEASVGRYALALLSWYPQFLATREV